MFTLVLLCVVFSFAQAPAPAQAASAQAQAPPQGAPAHAGPARAAPAPAAAPEPATGTLLVLNKSDATLWMLDPQSGERRAEVPTGRGPHEIAVSPDGRTAVVADYGEQAPGHTLTIVDLPRAAVIATLDLSPHERPHGLAFLPDGKRVAVTSESSGLLLLVDLEQGQVVAELPTSQAASHMVALAPDGSLAFVANIASGSLSAFTLPGGERREGERLAVVPTGAGAEGIDVTPDGKWVLVSNRAADTLSFVDAAALEEVAELPCGRFPIRVKVTPDGARALVSCANSGEVVLFDVAERKEVARIPMAPPAGDEAGADAGAEARGNLLGAEGPVPIGILIAPDGARAFIANTNVDAVSVLDLAGNRGIARFAAGRQPDGLGWTPLVVPAP